MPKCPELDKVSSELGKEGEFIRKKLKPDKIRVKEKREE